MDMFEYVAVLTSIVIGLAIAHLLQGMARLIQHHHEERIYWVHLAWTFHMFLLTVFWWWWEFGLGAVEVWTFQLYLFVVLYAVVLYLLCALLFPASLSGYDGYKDYFYSRRSWFFGLLIVAHLADVGDSWLKGAEYFAGLGTEYLVSMLARLILFGAAIFIKNERFQAILAVSLLLYQLSWALRLYETVA